VFGGDLVARLQVSDRARHFQDAVVGAGAEIQFGHRDANQLLRLVAELAMLLDLARPHSRVAVDLFVGPEARLLPLTGTPNAIADWGGGFFGARAGDVAIFDGWNFDVEIDAVEQRSGNSLAITLDLDRTAAAFAFQIAEVSARAWIHRGHEHELGRKCDAAGGARDRDFAVFERLAHDFERGAFKLGELVEKKDAMMGQTHFARRRNGGAAEQADVGNGVVRRAKGPRGDEGLFAAQHSGNAVDLGALDRFLDRHRRDDGGDAFRQHRFPGSGRADHEQVVAAGDGHFDCALHVSLPFHVAEVDFVILMRFEKCSQVAAGRLHRGLSADELESLPEILDTVDVDAFDHSGFVCVRFRNENGLLAAPPRFERHRQDTFYRTNGAIQCQFADEAEFLEGRAIQLFAHRDHSERDGQVETRPLLLDIRGREIDCRASARPEITAVADRSRDPIPALLHRGIGQPYDDDDRIAASAVDLDFHFVRVHTIDGSRINLS